MAKYKGFAGEVAPLNGLSIINAQGNYDAGRGADGLGFVMTRPTSRFGSSVPNSNRPSRISGRPKFAASLDPQFVLPRGAVYMGGAVDRATLLKKFPPYSGPMWTTNPVSYQPTGYNPTGAGDVPGITPRPVKGKSTVVPFRVVDLSDDQVIPPPLVTRILPKKPARRPTKAKTIRDRQAFINWIKNWAPQLYADAKKKADQVEANEGTLGQLGGWWETFTDSISSIGGKYLEFRTQKEILEAQLERMRAGQPPLQTSEYAPTIAIKPDPGTTREITGAIGAGFGKLLPFIAIGGLAIILLMRRR